MAKTHTPTMKPTYTCVGVCARSFNRANPTNPDKSKIIYAGHEDAI